jgi:hypothetical protein
MLFAYQTHMNIYPAQLLKFKNNKIILKCQNIFHNYRKLHKKTKVTINKAYFLFFFKAKDIF